MNVFKLTTVFKHNIQFVRRYSGDGGTSVYAVTVIMINHDF